MLRSRPLMTLMVVCRVLFSQIEPAAADHTDDQVAQVQAIQHLLASGKIEAAKTVAADAAAAASRTGSDRRTVADALELKREILIAAKEFQNALEPSSEVVAIRKRTAASEPFLYAIALTSHAAVLFGVEQRGAADTALLEARDAFRQAYPGSDIRLAGALESMADQMLIWNRPLLALDLRREGLTVRQSANGSKQKLADVLQSLAMLEMSYASQTDADAHLTSAIQLLEPEAQREQDPARRTLMLGGVSDMLILKAGIAVRAEHMDQALTLVERARHITTQEGEKALGFVLFIAQIKGQIAERTGDRQAAIDRALEAIDIVAQMTGPDALDLMADVTEDAGNAFFNAGNVAEAKNYLELAQQYQGKKGVNTWRIKLKLAEIAERMGAKTASEKLLAQTEQLRHEAMQGAKSNISEVRVFFGTNRAPLKGSPSRFGSEMGSALSFGEALILVPGGPGSKDADFTRGTSATGLLPPTDFERLLALKPVVYPKQKFTEEVASHASRAIVSPKTAIVFIHGFGTPFEFALKRTGQLIRDFGYDGPAFAFSWPSQGKQTPLAYQADHISANGIANRNGNDSLGFLIQFLQAVEDSTHADKIHIVAHSMGNQLLLTALRELQKHGPATLRDKIGELIFASPDVDQKEFQDAVETLSRSHMTLYATKRDKALVASWLGNLFSKRAGSVGWGYLSSGAPVIAKGVDSIDVTDAGPDAFDNNHDNYARNAVIGDDLRQLFLTGLHPPDARNSAVFKRCSAPDGQYWSYGTKTSRDCR